MARALATLVGLKSVDPACYGGWDGTNGCSGCELDVDHMATILGPLGYTVGTLKTREATADAVLRALDYAGSTLRAGDIFVFYFSGHGGQQPDTNGDEEQDHKDETLVAYNRELVDDELNARWLAFAPGVRVVMLSDSCNSGSNYKLMPGDFRATPMVPIPDPSVRASMAAELVHFGGCRDGATSSGYPQGGAFTTALWKVWDMGQFSGDYPALHSSICQVVPNLPGMSTPQQPQYNEYGPVTAGFRGQKPFTV